MHSSDAIIIPLPPEADHLVGAQLAWLSHAHDLLRECLHRRPADCIEAQVTLRVGRVMGRGLHDLPEPIIALLADVGLVQSVDAIHTRWDADVESGAVAIEIEPVRARVPDDMPAPCASEPRLRQLIQSD